MTNGKQDRLWRHAGANHPARKASSPEHLVSAYSLQRIIDVTAFFAWLNAKTGRELAPAGVTIFDVRKYREHLLAAGRKPADPNRRLASLRAFFAV